MAEEENETMPTDLSASIHLHNNTVRVKAIALLAWDADEKPGTEYYAPEDFDLAAHCKANGIDALRDEFGEKLEIKGSGFECAIIAAEGLIRQGLVKLA